MRAALAMTLVGFGLVSACGDDGTNHLADAAGGDARTRDGAPGIVDAPDGPVSLSVTSSGTGVAGIQVYFLNADSSSVSNATTDATGTATAIMVAGGSVTAVFPEAASSLVRAAGFPGGSLTTFAGVKPGDQLRVELGGREATPAPTVSVTITAPSLDNATEYALRTSCGDSLSLLPPAEVRAGRKHAPHATNPPITLALQNCSPRVDVLVLAAGSPPDAPDSTQTLGTIWLPQQALVDGGALSIAAPYAAVVAQPVRFGGVPAVATDLNLVETLIGPDGTVLSGDLDASTFIGSGASITASATMTQFPAAASTPPPTAVQLFVLDQTNADTVFNFSHTFTWGPAADVVMFDLSTDLAGYATRPEFDAATQQLTWAPTATGAAPDFVLGAMHVQRTGADSTVTTYAWQVLAPGSETGAIQYPTLPTDLFDFAIAATDNARVVDVDTYQVPGGYDAVRASFYGFDPTQAAVAGTAGVAQVTNGAFGELRRRGIARRCARSLLPCP